MDSTDECPGKGSTAAASISDRLACFNAKERWWLLRHTVGDEQFAPRQSVVAAMARCVGFPVPEPQTKVFAAMDYHLSWLHAALSDEQPRHGIPRWRANVAVERDGSSATRHAVENNQEDVDFILAYETRIRDVRAVGQRWPEPRHGSHLAVARPSLSP
jgi:hypothetical protein